jgi:hypothetical protein
LFERERGRTEETATALDIYSPSHGKAYRGQRTPDKALQPSMLAQFVDAPGTRFPSSTATLALRYDGVRNSFHKE